MAVNSLGMLRTLLLILLSILSTSVLSQPNGWRMIDRFYGFRYELLGNVIDAGIEEYAQQQAAQLGCFGWIQKTSRNTLVGEGRCSKKQGPVFEDLLRNKAQSMTVLVRCKKIYILACINSRKCCRLTQIQRLDYTLVILRSWTPVAILVFTMNLIDVRTLLMNQTNKITNNKLLEEEKSYNLLYYQHLDLQINLSSHAIIVLSHCWIMAADSCVLKIVNSTNLTKKN